MQDGGCFAFHEIFKRIQARLQSVAAVGYFTKEAFLLTSEAGFHIFKLGAEQELPNLIHLGGFLWVS